MIPLDQVFSEDSAVMSFGEHLDELRKRLIYALVVPVILAIVAFAISGWLVEIIRMPADRALLANGLPAQMQALDPAELILTQIKLAIVAAVVLSAPWILWQAWKFIQPGLHAHERRFVYFLIPGSAILTVSGLALLYWVLLPLMLEVLVGMGVSHEILIQPPVAQTNVQADATPPLVIGVLEKHPERPAPGQIWLKMPEQLLCVAPPPSADGVVHVLNVPLYRGSSFVPVYRVREYVDFVLLLALGVAIAFQTPLVIVLMGWLGIIEPKDLVKYRRHALFACAFAAAVITPSGDMFSLLVLMAPLYGLFELGILLLHLVPAERVASGNFFPRWKLKSSHKRQNPPARGDSPAQAAGSVSREPPSLRARQTDADEEADP